MDLVKAAELRNNGWSYREIGEALDPTGAGVQRALSMAGLTARGAEQQIDFDARRAPLPKPCACGRPAPTLGTFDINCLRCGRPIRSASYAQA